MKDRLIIVTRYFAPVNNGLSHHTVFLASLLQQCYDGIVVVCEKDPHRIIGEGSKAVTVVEFTSVREMFANVAKIVTSGSCRNTVLFQYVPHMWGRGGLAMLPSLFPVWMRIKHRVSVTSFLHELRYDWSFHHPVDFMLGIAHRAQLFLIAHGSSRVIVTNSVRYQALMRKPYSQTSDKLFRISVGCVSARNSSMRSPEHGNPYMTWFGTLSFDQKLEELVQAFCDVGGQCPGLRLLIVGAMDWNDQRVLSVQKYISDAGLEDRIILRGFMEEEELSMTLNDSLVNFHLASSGPSGRRTVVAAYLKAGRPIVAIRGHETDPEFVHGKNVYFVQPVKSSIGEAIVKLWSSAHIRDELSAGSIDLYESSYADSVVLRRISDALSIS